jgi:hypothetical protein
MNTELHARHGDECRLNTSSSQGIGTVKLDRGGETRPGSFSEGFVFPVEKIKRRVAEVYNVSVMEMMSEQRARRIAHARHVAMWLVRCSTVHSLPTIGRLFNRADHSTVINAVHRVRKILAQGGEESARIRALHKEVSAECDTATPRLIDAVGVVSQTLATRLSEKLIVALKKNPEGLLELLGKL